MRDQYRTTLLIGAAAGLLLMLLSTVLAPGTAQARMRMSNGGAIGYPGGGTEGDPLDSNDTGGDGGDIVHERRDVPPGPRGGGLFDLRTIGGVVTIHVEIVKGEPRIVIMIQPVTMRSVEARHGR